MTSFDRLDTNELKSREQKLTAKLEKANKELHAEILERKRVEEELHYIAEQRKLALEIAGLGTWEYDVASGLTRWDEKSSEIFGLSHNQPHTQEKVLALVHPEDRQRVIADIRAAIDPTGPGIYNTEYRVQQEDGTERWIAVRGRAFWRDKEQKLKPAQFLGTLMDITESKRAEVALEKAYQNLEKKVKERTVELHEAYNSLKESEERYRSIYESSLDGIMLTKPDGTILSANSQACILFDTTEEEIKQAGREGLVVKDEKLTSALKERKLKGQAKAELTFRRKDGSTFIGETSSSLFKDVYGNIKTSMIIRDITERKREDHKIRRYNKVLEGVNRIFGNIVKDETEEELGNACLSVALEVTGSQIGFVGEVGADGLLHDIAISDMGWSQCTMYDKTGHRRPPGNFVLQGLYGSVINNGRSFFTNDPQSHPDSIDLPRGHPQLKSFLGVPLILDKKKVGILAVANREDGYNLEQQEDLQAIAPAVAHTLQRKYEEQQLRRTEKALQENEKRFRALVTASSEVIYRMSPDWKDMNRLCGKGFLANTESPNQTWLEGYILPEDQSYVTSVINEAIRKKKIFELEHRVLRADGSVGWTLSRAVPMLDENGEIIEWFGAASDTTERKTAEENLKLSEERYRSFVENFKGIAFQIDKNFNLEFIHGAVKEITGYGEKELVSDTSWRQLVVPEDVDMFLEAEQKAVQWPDDYNGEIEYRIRTKDGKIKWMHEFHQKISGKSGRPEKYTGVIYDITEKKEIEAALEKIEIARQKELHHRIKNNLQVISSLLDLAADKFNNKECIKGSDVQDAFRESQDRVVSIALIHKELHETGGDDTLNFSPYLRRLVDNLFQTYRIGNTDISLNLDLEENVLFDMDIAIPLGMIVNELISNSFKYAFPETDKGTVQIKLISEQTGDELSNEKREYIEKCTRYTLIVSDDGVGISETVSLENPDTLGLQLVDVLVYQLNGEIELKRDKGTEFKISFIVQKS
jgi:PAS domain S-box-containing protein